MVGEEISSNAQKYSKSEYSEYDLVDRGYLQKAFCEHEVGRDKYIVEEVKTY